MSQHRAQALLIAIEVNPVTKDRAELAGILRELADNIEQTGRISPPIRDVTGRHVGACVVVEVSP